MCKELRDIIEKIIAENPDVTEISAKWDRDTCNGVIWVRIPGIDQNLDKKGDFLLKYTDYVNEAYGNPDPQYDECHTLVCAQSDSVEDDVYKLVYTKEKGVIDNAL